MMQLVISMNEQGQVEVNGPLDQKVLCFGLLEFAKQIIANYDPKRSKIIPAGPLDLPRNGGLN